VVLFDSTQISMHSDDIRTIKLKLPKRGYPQPKEMSLDIHGADEIAFNPFLSYFEGFYLAPPAEG